MIQFRERRNWAQYHNPKDLAISRSLEASELLEIFQWKNADEVEAILRDEKSCERVQEDLGDIFIYALNMSHAFGFASSEVILNKLRINEEKYPVEKSKGSADKYTVFSVARRGNVFY